MKIDLKYEKKSLKIIKNLVKKLAKKWKFDENDEKVQKIGQNPLKNCVKSVKIDQKYTKINEK